MILRLFRRKSKANETVVLRVYETIVAAARQKRFYAQFQVPDTPLGRYEMLSVHIFISLHRMKGENSVLMPLAQDIADEFFKDVDHSLRELGIGDQGVPKRMKKLARMFYGRVSSYGTALDADDKKALATALTRNIRPDLEFWPHAHYLSEYVFACRDRLANIEDSALAAGDITFMDADEMMLASIDSTKEANEND
ncbi:ubiquinol-cytochrome C chaperone family protein [Ochrobactrum sp. Sa2BUA5]|uniref:Ubiquinol-cytochrome C chaperone n=1 Tax=Ochrobactrum quorumnocens TaxID=271865 RepID=A0A5N1JW09_9HYPH|nr:ubiquinol-cytochrome C chaperone family protein [[Ochrobactrum] quorumnocens]KAA9361268.1 ubiquinol-cytochrome C chaperone [[Ochrobactrum] quorumnocens]MBD7992899.1 ubiquinol-cytochrome C chaperone family protein [Ochrobactrum gallinarum]